jgi:hypothetical protein
MIHKIEELRAFELSTMLTRHLYRIDEVKASCKYALLKKNYREALFWSMELIDTFMSSELKKIMIAAWFEGIGRASYPLFIDLVQADPDDLLDYVGAICSVERDASIFSLLALGSLDWMKQVDRVVPMAISGPEDLEIRCILRALKQGKALFAWTLLRCREDIWDLLEKVVSAKERYVLSKLQEIGSWESKAAATLLICDKGTGGWKAVRRYVDMGLFTEFSELEGRRARRIFKTRPEAIAYKTGRGEMSRSMTNIQEIREPLTALYGSPYWDRVAEDFGGWRPIYKNDEAKETFYDLYFPDDIPDEWSQTDQEKSHGAGLAFDDQTVVDRRWKHYSALLGLFPSMGLVSLTRDAIKVGIDVDLYRSKQESWKENKKRWKLEPASKRLNITSRLYFNETKVSFK